MGRQKHKAVIRRTNYENSDEEYDLKKKKRFSKYNWPVSVERKKKIDHEKKLIKRNSIGWRVCNSFRHCEICIFISTKKIVQLK